MCVCMCDIHTYIQLSVIVHTCECHVEMLDVNVYNSLPHSFDRFSH